MSTDRSLLLVSSFVILTSSFATAGQWHGIYDDAPIAVHITPNGRLYHVGDTFRLSITATNTSDRALLIKRDWKEQLVFYHLMPQVRDSGSGADSGIRTPVPSPQPPTPFRQIEWPGQLLIATWTDSSDVVRLEPNESYTVNRDVRVWTTDDVATFPFRLKLGGIKDFGHKFAMWQGVAWSNPIALTVKPKP
jgi:hypothetical protein